ncbi:MAG: response regulator [Candidatus Pacebacteria bacterium CG10_big_fil_rev_8_21_14_0_10_56_10]|nr:MAG: response regulator [Candidatus Pacebacteria bacterium CG10_big_fil_rev_8_21_14_0_10_56_10]
MKKILVVEDDAFLANAYKVKLSKTNFQVRIADSGQHAIEEITTFKPDLILLDLVIPEVDGFEVLSQLRQSPQASHIPVLVVSNLAQEEDIQKAKELGAQEFIVKSEVALEAIVGRINSLLPDSAT